ncbi:bifunctional metallophosphatase/5'-nucleotidase [Solibacillus sp. A46]|uniref:Bifunctional metallophosphatase/5'-nucleotidase n=1 Tax=Solibacillus faecavium TaxID=2762221 RepID=A0ABR8XTL9_9BACL|nr:bifunctional UDP-sugar hydrolase/5'-nucleotidase [Solibacillus faecavium]MBD8035267.1 bifunctional metallophosphatase/5'-nucleotidase [Solibacillus faecavium]
MQFSIIATSDIHGHTERFSQLAQMISKRQPALLIDNGDFLQGSHLSYYYDHIIHKQHPQIELANALGYDVGIFGNHEFNYPPEKVRKIQKACNFPWIAANITGFAKPYFIKEIHGIRIAVVGVVTHFTKLWDETNSIQHLHFEQAFESAKNTVNYVREVEKAHFVILSYHGGFERDLHNGNQIDLEHGENEGYRMLYEIDGIDVFITGHQHLEIATKINGISVVQPGANAHCFAQIDVTIENDQIIHEPSLVHVDSSLPIQPFPEFNGWKKEVIGSTENDLTYSDFFTPRIASSSYTQLIHDMQLHYSGAQISVIELPYHFSGGFQKVITREQVIHNMPRANRLLVVEMTGADIREAIEQSAAVFALNNKGEVDFSLSVFYPEPQPYIYDLWGGIDYEINLSNPVGQRVVRLNYNGCSIQDTSLFEVAVNSYRATGAHHFHMFKKQPIRESKKFIPDLMMEYIEQNSPLTVELKNYFTMK